MVLYLLLETMNGVIIQETIKALRITLCKKAGIVQELIQGESQDAKWWVFILLVQWL